MAVDLRRSTDLKDSFTGISVFSLVPRTLPLTGDHAPPPLAAENDHVYFRSILDSMINKESAKLLNQCQAISGKNANVKFDDRGKMMLMNGKDSMQTRRPALDRKRARFSLKPDSSLSLPTFELNSSIESIEDPEEYFLACENLANADEELRKLKCDVCIGYLEQKQPATFRRHRLALEFPASSDNAEGAMLLQANTYNLENFSQSQIRDDMGTNSSLQSEERVGKSLPAGASISNQHRATGGEGSMSKEKEADDLFSSLLARKDLDEEKGQAFLLESLQIQHVDVGMLRTPYLPSFQKDETNVLSNGYLREKEENAHHQASPSIPSSPLAEIFAYQRQFSLKTRCHRLFDGDDVSLNGECSPKVNNTVFDQHDICSGDATGAIAEDVFVPGVDDSKRSTVGTKVDSPVERMSKKVGDMVRSIRSHKLVLRKDSSEDRNVSHHADKDDEDALSIGVFSQNSSQNGDQSEGSASSPLENDSGSGIAPVLESQLTLMPSNKNSSIKGNKPDSPELGSGETLVTKTTTKQHLAMHSSCSLEGKPVDGDINSGLDSGVLCDGYIGHQGKESDDSRVDITKSAEEIPGLECGMLKEPLTEHSLSTVERGIHFDQRKAGNTDEVNSAGAGGCLYEVKAGIDQSTAEDCSELSRGRSNGDTDPPGHNMSANKLADVLVHAEPGYQDANIVDDRANCHEAISERDEDLQNASTTLEENCMGLRLESLTLPERGGKRKAVMQRQKKRNDSTGQSHADTGESTSDGSEKLCPVKKQKVLSRRQSLAGSGMTWQSGVRRSTRKKFRPLQHWLGERFIYGRVHDSLATVIGVKYASPGDSILKVKSYVSEEYADLVAQASLY